MSALREKAYSFIRNGISAGLFAAGDRLSPAALAKQIGISHIPIREAISQLHSEGLVNQVPRRGAFVRRPGRGELAELIELRKVLECNAAAQAARRIGDAELSKLDAYLRDLHAIQKEIAEAASAVGGKASGKSGKEQLLLEPLFDSLARWQLIDLAFHLLILRAARNRWVLKVMEDTNVMTRMFGYRSDRPDNWADMATYMSENLELHRQIFFAIRAHDSKAARRAMAEHMRRAERNMLARYDWLIEESRKGEKKVRDFPQSFRDNVKSITSQGRKKSASSQTRSASAAPPEEKND